MATRGGAKALGMESMIGSLEVGKQADVIVVDTNRPHLTPMYDPYSHLVYAAKASDVTHSIINGRLVMERRELLSIDFDEIAAGVKKKAKEILRWVSG